MGQRTNNRHLKKNLRSIYIYEKNKRTRSILRS